MDDSDPDGILNEQIAYYRERAAEYDEWFYRKGRYDRGVELNQQWFKEAQVVREALHHLPKQLHILEFAGGTGIWTQELVTLADQVTVVDAAPEMIQINKAKVQSLSVNYIHADIFNWQPNRVYDMVFFGFWLSHVPPDKLAPFLELVASALKPGGLVFMIDSRSHSTGTATNQSTTTAGFHQQRRLNDGREFQIVKIYYETQPLEAAFRAVGLNANLHFTDTYFIYGQASKFEST